MDNKYQKIFKNFQALFILLVSFSIFFLKTPSAFSKAPAESHYKKGYAIIKLKDDGKDAVEDSADDLFNKKGSFSIDSLDKLKDKFKIQSIKPLMQHKHKDGEKIKAIELENQKYYEEIKAKFPKRSQRSSKREIIPFLSHVYRVKLPQNIDIEQFCLEFKKDPHVAYCHPDYFLKANSDSMPNDPFLSSYGSWGQDYYDLWNLRKIGMINDNGGDGLWGVTQGENVVIAIIDSGVDLNHEELQGALWTNPEEIPENNKDDDADGRIDDVHGWNFESNDSSLIDFVGHGTFVAGIIAAKMNNATGIAGIAPQAKLMILKTTFSFDTSAVSQMIEAINYAIKNGADIINLSWTTSDRVESVPALEDAIKLAHAMGLIIVVAAGNQTDDVQYYSPANMAETITVASSDFKDEIVRLAPSGFRSGSNYGFWVDITAPGQDVLSLNTKSVKSFAAQFAPSLIVKDDYFRVSGTSISAAHVSAAAAMLLSINPNLSNEDVRQILRISADDLGDPGFDKDFGFGRLNIRKAVNILSIPRLEITNPSNKSSVNTHQKWLPVKGWAYGKDFESYDLSYCSLSEGCPQWISLPGPVLKPVSENSSDNDTLALWNISRLDLKQYLLRLHLKTKQGLDFYHMVQFEATFENAPPVFKDLHQKTGQVGELLKFHVKAVDPDGDKLVFSAINLPRGAEFSNVEAKGDKDKPAGKWTAGLFQWIPSPGQEGIYSVQFEVKDEYGLSTVSEPVAIIINKKIISLKSGI